jgi:flagellar biosynthesis/type III secretory pathway protein FliH
MTLIKAERVRYEASLAMASQTPDAIDHLPVDGTRGTPGLESTREADPRPDARNDELLALREALEQASAQHAQSASDAEARVAAAYESGLSEGLAQGHAGALRDFDHRDSAIRAGIASALDAFHASLHATEALATEIALAALERMIGETDTRARMVAQSAAHHMTQLASESAVVVEFSNEDFESDDDAARVFSGFSMLGNTVRIVTTPRLKAGACLIRLKLGTLDASLDGQLARIRTALWQEAT